MDWNSPTTMKHIAEAKAQGCELIGSGRSAQYRTYRLSCGHEQDINLQDVRRGYIKCANCLDARLRLEAEVHGCKLLGEGKKNNYRVYLLPCQHEQEIQLKCMRLGRFRCQICQQIKLETEAQAQGCELVGAGKSANLRTYRLPCGHRKECSTVAMRMSPPKCPTCVSNKLEKEAKSQDCVLLSKGRNKSFRLYRLPCGHEQEITPSNMRAGRYWCRTCIENKWLDEAEAQGCELLGEGKNGHSRLYQLKCGHEQSIEIGDMREGQFVCLTCLSDKHKAEAEAQGCVLLGKGMNKSCRVYKLPCGHQQQIQLSGMREGLFRCRICLKQKHEKEAKAVGCVLLGQGRSIHVRKYRLPCGHEQDIHLDCIRLGTFSCQVCEDWAYTQPSQAYLLHIKVGPDEWLKLGFAKNIDTRVGQYGLASDAMVTVLKTKDFDTGKEAQEFERLIHKRYRRKRLTPKQMADFHSKSGQTECYPLIMVDQLLAEFSLDNSI